MKPFVLTEHSERFCCDYTITVFRGSGYIRHTAVARCEVFGQKFKRTVYNDDINEAIRDAGNSLIRVLERKFG